MTLESLFNEIKYGKDKFANMKASTSNSKHFDEDYKLYITSARIKELEPLLGESTKINPLIKKMQAKFEDYENKILSGNFASSIYARMKMDSIVENYNDLATVLTENVKEIRLVDTDILGRMLGSIKAGIKMLSEKAEKEVVFASFPVKVEKSLNEEFKVIEEILAE